MKKMIVAAVLAASVSTVAAAQAQGDWVLAPWQGSHEVYPGVVQSRHGQSVNVRFDDGSIAAVPASRIRPYNWRVGQNVECQWTDGRWYAAVITGMGGDGTTIGVRYEDGVNQRTNTGKCRSH